MNNYYDVLVAPIITEKSTKLIESSNKYCFRVNKTANKIVVRQAVETAFKVTVLNVAIVNVVPKPKRRGRYEGFQSGYKKAIVELAPGNKIDAFNV
jgi:large subunit ribosomal protein L23